MRRRLVVMAKAPIAGGVKSRLAADIGAVEATRFYRSLLAGTLRRIGNDPRWTTSLAISPDSTAAARVWPAGFERIPQGPGDLGERMERLMRRLPEGPVVIIGSDIPGVRPEHIATAFSLLGHRDAVFGPAKDGGYWLVGLRRRPRVPGIFGAVRWSTSNALKDTLANCRGLKFGFVEMLADVDTVEEWRQWRRALG